MTAQINRSLRLFVGNLPWTVSRRELREYFQKFGSVKQASVLFNKDTGMSRGYGFVQLGSREAYMAVVSQNSHILEHTKIVVHSANIRSKTENRKATEPNLSR